MHLDQIGHGFADVLRAAQTGAGWALERIWCAYAGRVQGYLRLHGADEPEDLTAGCRRRGGPLEERKPGVL